MKLGVGFFVALIGGAIGACVAGMALFMLFGWAWYTLGFFGAFAAFSLLVIVGAFLYDRREHRKRVAV